jgi:hypothetical protein
MRGLSMGQRVAGGDLPSERDTVANLRHYLRLWVAHRGPKRKVPFKVPTVFKHLCREGSMMGKN